MTTERTIVVAVKGEDAGGRVVKRTLDDIANSGNKARSSTDALEASMQGLNRTANILKSALGGFAAGLTISSVIKLSDQYQTLNARLREATKSTNDYATVQREVIALSIRTGSAIEANVTLFQRLSNSRGDLGAMSVEILRVAETVSKLGAVGGATNDQIKNGTIQLSQALSGGIVRAEEFNSVVENMNPVAQAVAKQMGISFGKLRAEVIAGNISSKEFFDALLAASKEADEAFANMPINLGRATENLKTSFQVLIGDFDAGIKGTQSFASSIDYLAKNLGTLAEVLVDLGAIFGAVMIGRIAGATAAFATNTIAVTRNALAQKAAAIEALNVAEVNRMGAVVALQSATQQAVLSKSYLGVRDAGLNLATAQRSLVLAQEAVAVSTITLSGVFKTLLAFFGGPLGVALTALSIGYFYLTTRTTEAQEAQERLNGVYNGFLDINSKLNTATGKRREELLLERDAALEAANAEYKLAQAAMSAALVKYESTEGMNVGAKAFYQIKSGIEMDSALERMKNAQKTLQDMKDQLAAPGIANGSGADMSTNEDGLKAMNSQLKSLVQSTQTWQEKIADLEAMRPFAKTQEQLTAIDRAVDKIRIDVEKNGVLAKAFESFASGIDDGMKDAFRDGFSSTGGGFKKMLEGMKSSFTAFLSDLAYTALARPILLNITAALGGSLGLSSGTVGSILGTSSGSGGGLSLSNLSSLGNLSSLFGTNQALVGAVNKLGSFLGIGGVGANGPLSLSGMSSFTNGSFGGTLGAGIGGFGGNMLANALFGGDRGVGSTIGGTIGAIAGSFIPIPVVGPLIGSFLGNAIGGLFGGGKPSNMAQWGGVDLSSGEILSRGGQTGKKYSESNSKFTDAVLGNASTLAAILKEAGGETTGTLNVTVGNRDGLWLHSGGMKAGGVSDSYKNFGTDSKALVSAVMQRVIDQTTGLSATMQGILDKVGTKDLDKLKESITFGLQYEALLKSDEVVDPLTTAIEALNTQFDELRKKATELGLPTDKLSTIYEQQKKAITDSIKAQQAGFSNLESMTKAFTDFLNGQALGSNSSLDPMGKLNLAQGSFDDLLGKARGGDMSVTQDLLKAANDLLTIGRGVYASSVSFAGLETFVRSSISEIAKAAGVPGFATGGITGEGYAMTGENGKELINLRAGSRVHSAGETASIMALSGNVASDVARSNAQMISINAETLEEMREMRKEMRQLRKQAERTANNKVVNGA